MNEVVLSLRNITKTYPGVLALDRFSLDFFKGEVHALLGENGAGKSTLIKTIAGAIRPDSGTIAFGKKEYAHVTPALSRSHGVEVIYQEFNLIGTLSAAENICLGEKLSRFVDRRRMEKKAKEIFELFEVDIDPSSLVRDLSSSQQQIVEIAKAISKNPSVIIMDEPSAPLSVTEVEHLFRIIGKAKARGVTILYISHRIDELFVISDRVSIMRDGCYVATKATKETTRKELINLMVGRELKESFLYNAAPRKEIGSEVVLELRGVYGNGDENISFTLHKGEILGFAGLVGAGRTELAKVIFGAEKKDAGDILINGQKVSIKSPRDAISHGLGLIPENRKEEGCFLEQTLRWNISIATIRSLSKRFIVDRKKEDALAESYRSLLQIKTPDMGQRVKNLSGGNQQKVVMAKTLATNSSVLIFDEPTRGIDVGARQEIYKQMILLAERGNAILMITSDMEELIGMSDRILVLSEGKLAGIVEKAQFSQNYILELASGNFLSEKKL